MWATGGPWARAQASARQPPPPAAWRAARPPPARGGPPSPAQAVVVGEEARGGHHTLEAVLPHHPEVHMLLPALGTWGGGGTKR